MGMAEDELLAHPVRHIIQGKAALLLFHLGMEHHLEEHVTKLFAQMLGASLVDGLAGLIGLLQQIAADGLVVLLRVPGAASRRAQNGYDPLQVGNVIAGLTLKIYHIFPLSATPILDFFRFLP